MSWGRGGRGGEKWCGAGRAMKIVRRDVSTVFPATPCEPCVMYMSGADHIVRPRHIPLLVFYAARGDGTEVKIVLDMQLNGYLLWMRGEEL